MFGPGTISLRLVVEIAALGIVMLNIVAMGLLLRVLVQLQAWLEQHGP